MNPAALFKLMSMKNSFENRHPRAVSFVTNELLGNIPAGTVLEVSITRPEEKTVTTNLKISAEDLEMLAELKQLLA